MTELMMGGLITRARARRRATRRLRESAYAYSRYLLVSHPRVASYFSSLATYLRCTTYAVMVYSTKLSKEKHWDFHSGPGLAAATYLFFDFLLQAKRSVAGERMQRDCSSSQPSRSMAQGRQAHARAEAALPLAHTMVASTTSRDRARAATCAEESRRDESKSA